MEKFMENYLTWVESDKLSDAERAELLSIRDDEDEIKLRFSSYLSFGTAGLRGTMKTGMNAMNVHTVAYATQGLANLIIQEGRASDGVVIAYDCRINSELFAKTAARVLAAADIPVYIFDELRPTPELSFALRELGCVAGINITASHNPKQYNGYKAYWEDGAQLPPEHADVVAAAMNSLDIFRDVYLCDFDEALANGKIKLLGREMDEKYLDNVVAQAVNPQAVAQVADDLKIVYSPLHGTGYRLVPEVLSRTGLKHLYTVSEQMKIDGAFPTVEKPNPEYREVFELGIKIANEVGSDLVIATDPDADRVGVVTRTKDGGFTTITGNQMGALLLDYILTAYEETGNMPDSPYAVKTIVTTELAARVCEAHGVKMHNVLTGFKFIGEVIKSYEAKGYGSFILGFEESYGYLKGTYARDKDAVVATMLICEMTAYYKAKNMTLSDALEGLYAKYGYFSESNVEIYMEGIDGPRLMAEKMDALRNPCPDTIDGKAVTVFADYKKQEILDKTTGNVSSTNLPASNVLSFTLDNGDVIVVRPSGTEPKIKYYFLLRGENKADTDAKLANYKRLLDL
ncbi:MAG: phospho-sugar mutase [Clostridia bacterium]|nr:phospho-sugar mutase [Clostridia bacterium]